MKASIPQAAEVRKQRLLREVAGGTEGSVPSFGGFTVIASVTLAFLILGVYPGDPSHGGERAAKRAGGQTVTLAASGSPVVQRPGEAGRTQLESNVEDMTY